ncbi:uncharacterized protein LOC143180132 [Calliopsis andreniformis]|uniref:uncharacterized protein LOC143180132 n=1 Tax=Calliopsis andreniformis TaxID=337506 RepID=UPI003FCD8C70
MYSLIFQTNYDTHVFWYTHLHWHNTVNHSSDHWISTYNTYNYDRTLQNFLPLHTDITPFKHYNLPHVQHIKKFPQLLTALTPLHRCSYVNHICKVQSVVCIESIRMHGRSIKQVDNTVNNVHYQHDFHHALQLCKGTLQIIGVWSLVHSSTSRLEKFLSIFILIWGSFVLLFGIIPPSHYIIFAEKNLYKRMKMVGPTGFGLASLIKYFYLGLRRTIFQRCFLHIEKDWERIEEASHREIMLQQVSISRRLITLCIVFLVIAGMSYDGIMPFFAKPYVMGNITMRALSEPSYSSLFDIVSTPSCEIIYFLCVCASFMKYGVTTGAYSITTTCVTHICGQIQIQIARLNDLVENKQKSRDPLPLIIRDHMKILRFSKNVELGLQEIYFTEIVESTVIICLLGYYCLMEWHNSDATAIITYFMLLFSFTFNIFIFCYVGQILSDQVLIRKLFSTYSCSEIGPATYNIDWYNLSPEKARSLIMINAISLYPPKLTAGKIFILNLITFSSVRDSLLILLFSAKAIKCYNHLLCISICYKLLLIGSEMQKIEYLCTIGLAHTTANR